MDGVTSRAVPAVRLVGKRALHHAKTTPWADGSKVPGLSMRGADTLQGGFVEAYAIRPRGGSPPNGFILGLEVQRTQEVLALGIEIIKIIIWRDMHRALASKLVLWL